MTTKTLAIPGLTEKEIQSVNNRIQEGKPFNEISKEILKPINAIFEEYVAATSDSEMQSIQQELQYVQQDVDDIYKPNKKGLSSIPILGIFFGKKQEEDVSDMLTLEQRIDSIVKGMDFLQSRLINNVRGNQTLVNKINKTLEKIVGYSELLNINKAILEDKSKDNPEDIKLTIYSNGIARLVDSVVAECTKISHIKEVINQTIPTAIDLCTQIDIQKGSIKTDLLSRHAAKHSVDTIKTCNDMVSSIRNYNTSKLEETTDEMIKANKDVMLTLGKGTVDSDILLEASNKLKDYVSNVGEFYSQQQKAFKENSDKVNLAQSIQKEIQKMSAFIDVELSDSKSIHEKTDEESIAATEKIIERDRRDRRDRKN